MGASQGKCCEKPGRREADHKMEMEEQSMVTQDCQDAKAVLDGKAEVAAVAEPVTEDAQNIQVADKSEAVVSDHADPAPVEVEETSGLAPLFDEAESPITEGGQAKDVDDVVAQSHDAEAAKEQAEQPPENTDEVAKQPEEPKEEAPKEAEPKAAAKKAAAKKAVAKTKAKAKAKAEAKAAANDEVKPVAEAAPKKKIPMNAKEREAAWNALTKEEQTAEAGKLCKSIEDKDMNAIGRLMKEGVKCDTRNEAGETALYVAAKGGDTDLLEFLISNCGASINFTTKNKETALHAACKFDKKEAMEWLVSAGIDRNAKNKKGNTAADVATGETAKSEILQFKMTSKK